MKPSGVDGPPAATPRTPRTLRRQELGISLLVPRPHYALFHNRENRQHHRPATLTLGRTPPYRGGVSTMHHDSRERRSEPSWGPSLSGRGFTPSVSASPVFAARGNACSWTTFTPWMLIDTHTLRPLFSQHLPLLSLKHPRQQAPPKLRPNPSTIFYFTYAKRQARLFGRLSRVWRP